MSVEQSRHAWRIAGISIATLLLLVLVLYQQTVLYLSGLWNNFEIGEYGHGYLVLAISIFLVVRNRRQLALLTPCPNYRALPAVITACLLWLASVLVDVNMMQTVGLLLIVLAVIWMVLGSKVTSAMMFPVLFLGFAIPIWFPLSPLLQDLTADVVFWFIRLLDVPALRQENMIIVPAGNLSIEEACSGLRYLLAALTLGMLYAYLNYETFRARLLVVLISAAAAVVANIVRVFIVVYLGYATEMQHPYVHDHLMLGWYLFGGLVAMLLFIDTRLYRHYRESDANSEANHAVLQPERTKYAVCTKGKQHYAITLIVTAIIVSIAPAIVYAVNNQPRMKNIDIDIRLPAGTGGWKGPLVVEDDWMPVYHGAITTRQQYIKDNDQIITYIGYYPAQKQGQELINDLNRINNKEIWRTRYPRARLNNTGARRVLEQLMQKSDGTKRLVWYWYRVAGRKTTNKYVAKMLQVVGLLGRDTQAHIVAIAVDANDDIELARGVLTGFVETNEGQLTKFVTE